MKPASVEFRQVCKHYGKHQVVRGMNFLIQPGHLVTLLGPSGCGKTTTLRLIAGLEMASGGQILIDGKDVTLLPTTERSISMVFQSYALFPHMTVGENVGYGLKMHRWKPDEIREKIMAGLKLVGLSDFEKRLPSELSGGQQQRVAVARAMVLEPQVLLFDEPLSNLDVKLRRQVRQEIRDLQQQIGCTAVYVTHDQEEALAVSDQILVMQQGEMVQMGSPHELYNAPKNGFIADFIGDSNLVSVTIESLEGPYAQVRMDEHLYQLPHRDFLPGPATLSIRPQSIVLAAPTTQNHQGTISKVTYLGSHMEYEVESSLGSLFVSDEKTNHPWKKGDLVGIGVASHGICLVQ